MIVIQQKLLRSISQNHLLKKENTGEHPPTDKVNLLVGQYPTVVHLFVEFILIFEFHFVDFGIKKPKRFLIGW